MKLANHLRKNLVWQLKRAVRFLRVTRKSLFLPGPGSLPKGFHEVDLPDGNRIDGWQTLAYLNERLDTLGIKEGALRGRRILDVGAAEGFFTFALEKMGAQIHAIDVAPNPAFLHYKKQSGSDVQYSLCLIEELTNDQLSSYDLILVAGILETLPAPVAVLDRMLSNLSGILVVMSGPTGFSEVGGDVPAIEIYPQPDTCPRYQNRPNSALFRRLSEDCGVRRTLLYKSDRRDHGVVVFCNDPVAADKVFDFKNYEQIQSTD